VSLDIEMAISMAPGAKIVVYEATGVPGEQPADDLMNDIATNTPLCNQISSSWSGWGAGDTTTAATFLEFQAQGQAYFNASGDSGALAKSNERSPGAGPVGVPDSTSPYLIEVGGTSVTSPSNSAPIAYGSETTWNDISEVPSQGPSDPFASGGGICNTNQPFDPNFPSQILAIPTYQAGVSMASNGGSTVYRNIPDLAMVAENFVVIDNDESIYPPDGSSDPSCVSYNCFGWDTEIVGTSAAAPLWAAFMALTNQQAALQGQAPVGFANPSIYSVGIKKIYVMPFHDITTGNNGIASYHGYTSYSATTGYDLCTGWGSPNGMNTINALLGNTVTETPSYSNSPTITETPTVTPTFSSSPTFSDSPTLSATRTVSPTFSASPTVTPTPRYATSSLGRNILAPVPAVGGRSICLYFDKKPSSSEWTVYNIAGENVATLNFQSQYSQCWDTTKVASGIYFARIKMNFEDGSEASFIQNVAVIR
jgi:subtilase family serine protease